MSDAKLALRRRISASPPASATFFSAKLCWNVFLERFVNQMLSGMTRLLIRCSVEQGSKLYLKKTKQTIFRETPFNRNNPTAAQKKDFRSFRVMFLTWETWGTPWFSRETWHFRLPLCLPVVERKVVPFAWLPTHNVSYVLHRTSTHIAISSNVICQFMKCIENRALCQRPPSALSIWFRFGLFSSRTPGKPTEFDSWFPISFFLTYLIPHVSLKHFAAPVVGFKGFPLRSNRIFIPPLMYAFWLVLSALTLTYHLPLLPYSFSLPYKLSITCYVDFRALSRPKLPPLNPVINVGAATKQTNSCPILLLLPTLTLPFQWIFLPGK